MPEFFHPELNSQGDQRIDHLIMTERIISPSLKSVRTWPDRFGVLSLQAIHRDGLFTHSARKLYVITPVTFTGWPPSLVRENFAPRAAATETSCNNGCPDTACAEITLPSSSSVTWTTTVPDNCACLAISG